MRQKHQKDEDDDFGDLFGDLFQEGKENLPNDLKLSPVKKESMFGKRLLVLVAFSAILAAMLAVTGVRKF
jgi:hypothetical protein